MKTIRQILQRKGSDFWSVTSKASTFSALQIMADKDVGALLVIDGGKLVGIFSERDYARKVILKDKSSKTTPVSVLMTTDVLYANATMILEDCMALMYEKRVRHLPVMENNQPIGVVSLGDVVGMIISDQKFTIKELEKYITGSA
jgi:CBS domain-containing protein